MRIVPVIDVRCGVVVRAVGGRRAEYRPLVSAIARSTDPLEVAEALRARYGHAEIYVADLDAICGERRDFDLYRRLRVAGFALWIDAGIRGADDMEAIAEVADVVVVGLETLRAPLRQVRLATDRVAFSLDMRDGTPLGNRAAWGTDDALPMVERVVEAGIRRVIVLDLARVGSASGVGCESLCAKLLSRFPEIELTVGGGIRGWDDIRRLESLGVAGVLVASALHDGRL